MSDLPPTDTVRWSPSRKAAVVQAIAAGDISADDAMARYSLSLEELASWQQRYTAGGPRALGDRFWQERRRVA